MQYRVKFSVNETYFRTDWFDPNRVKHQNSAIHPATPNVEEGKEGEEGEEGKEGKEGKEEKLQLEEELVAASESFIYFVMPGVSSKKKTAAAQMVKAMMESIVKGGFMESDSTVFFSGDFEFFKFLAGYALLNQTNIICFISGGHACKSLAVTQLGYNEQQQAKALLEAGGTSFGSPKYNKLMKGTHIDTTTKTAIRHGKIGISVLAKRFFAAHSESVLSSENASCVVTVGAYILDPELLVDKDSRSHGWVLDHSGRPIIVPLDKYGKKLVDLFLTFVSTISKSQSVPEQYRWKPPAAAI